MHTVLAGTNILIPFSNFRSIQILPHTCGCKLNLRYFQGRDVIQRVQGLFIRCGRVVTDFDWEAKNRFNF